MRKIIIDCDPGHDDAIALMVAFSETEKLDILAIGTVGGNHHIEKITENARLVLQTLNAKIPLYQGIAQPLMQALPIQPGAHGESGMDGLSYIPDISYPVQTRNAVDAYRDCLLKENKVTLVALGPLTNVAMLLKMYPEVIKSIETISIMGGGINRGNITAHAEFNIYADPEAAKIVFDSGVPITMSGLDVTEQACLTGEDINYLEGKGRVSQVAYELLKFYHESGKQFGFVDAAMHDACAVCVLTRPEFFKFESYPMTISLDGITRGMTCADRRIKFEGAVNVDVAMHVKQQEFASYILSRILRLDGVEYVF